ncbi:MAG: asparagine synthetase B family protein, partial [Candidatus Zixiibacteriota bacterium]
SSLINTNYEALADYIFASRALGSKSMFEKINEVEPGYMVTVDRQRGDVKVKKYWDLEFNYNTSRSLDDVKEELFFLLDDAVKVHCRSDAPLGCHLSGGMDTSIIVALAARYRENMNTFSIKFSDEPYIDETKYAKAVASKAGTQYQEGYPSAANMATLLPILQWHMDAPMATDGGFSYFTVSHLARESVKVTLTGHGGDEVFAGYPAQFYASYNTTEMFKQQLDPNRIAPIQQGNKIIEKYLQKGFKGIYKSVIKRFFTGRESLEDLWIKLHCGNLPEDNVFLQQSFINSLQGYSPRDDYVKPLKENNAEYTLDKCLYHDLRIYLPGLLHLEDRASMALSLESRVPIIDYRIVEFLATIPPEQKVVDLKPKYLLREIGSSLLPDIVRKREDKSGFKVPGKFWFTPEVKDFVKNILLSSDSLNRGIFKENVLKAAYDAPSNLLTWNIMNIELWFKIFIDRDPNWTDKTGLENLPSIHKS